DGDDSPSGPVSAVPASRCASTFQGVPGAQEAGGCLRHSPFVALALLLLVAVAHGQAPRRLYHRVTIEQLAAGRVPWPYAQLIGRVRMVRTEQDGDLHIKLTGTTAFVVLEVI